MPPFQCPGIGQSWSLLHHFEGMKLLGGELTVVTRPLFILKDDQEYRRDELKLRQI